MKTPQPQNPEKKRKIIAVLIIAIALLVTSGGYLLLSGRFDLPHPFSTANFNEKKSSEADRPVNDVDYSGPSPIDTEESQEGKKKADEQADSTSPESSNSQQNVSVAVSFADVSGDNFEVRAFIPSAVEGGGTCTVIMTKESARVQRSSEAFVDTSSSQCRPIFIPLSEFSSRGSWNINVTYSSTTHKGESGSFEVAL